MGRPVEDYDVSFEPPEAGHQPTAQTFSFSTRTSDSWPSRLGPRFEKISLDSGRRNRNLDVEKAPMRRHEARNELRRTEMAEEKASVTAFRVSVDLKPQDHGRNKTKWFAIKQLPTDRHRDMDTQDLREAEVLENMRRTNISTVLSPPMVTQNPKSDTGILWVRGIAGAGKSTLTRFVDQDKVMRELAAKVPKRDKAISIFAVLCIAGAGISGIPIAAYPNSHTVINPDADILFTDAPKLQITGRHRSYWHKAPDPRFKANVDDGSLSNPPIPFFELLTNPSPATFLLFTTIYALCILFFTLLHRKDAYQAPLILSVGVFAPLALGALCGVNARVVVGQVVPWCFIGATVLSAGIHTGMRRIAGREEELNNKACGKPLLERQCSI